MFKALKSMFGGKEKLQILAPVAGQVIPMKEVNDPTFSMEILGKGVAIVPETGRVVAPADGVVEVLFDTLHAVSIRTTAGTELIIHVGLDTVNLKGEPYTAHCKVGDSVKAGDLLLEFDIDKIKAAGYEVVTPVIICNSDAYPNMVCKTGMQVKELDPVIELD